jgi:hypothetical protein
VSLLRLHDLSSCSLLRGVVVLLVSMSEDRHGSMSAEMNQARSRRERGTRSAHELLLRAERDRESKLAAETRLAGAETRAR